MTCTVTEHVSRSSSSPRPSSFAQLCRVAPTSVHARVTRQRLSARHLAYLINYLKRVDTVTILGNCVRRYTVIMLNRRSAIYGKRYSLSIEVY